MRWLSMVLVTAAATALASPAVPAAPGGRAEFLSRAAVVDWMDHYRFKPQPARLPEAILALSETGAFREPEAAGFHVGFVAGVLGANSKQAEQLTNRMTKLPPADQWLLVRALAYSGLPAWKSLLARVADKLPSKRAMIDEYLTGRLPTLDQIELDKSPTFLENLGRHFGIRQDRPPVSYGRNPELLDTLWGEYFAAGRYRPIWRIMTLLPWSKERDDADRLAVGSSAKYTLANNAARYPDILSLIKEMQPYQADDVRPILAEVINAAETNATAGIKKEQMAAIEKLKAKGPGYQRDMKLWGYVGQGAIGVTCVTLAVLSFSAAGIPCVIGGAATSAALNYWAAQ